jgi:hypothetical protein
MMPMTITMMPNGREVHAGDVTSFSGFPMLELYCRHGVDTVEQFNSVTVGCPPAFAMLFTLTREVGGYPRIRCASAGRENGSPLLQQRRVDRVRLAGTDPRQVGRLSPSSK